jgi:hypothetical protein
MQPAAGLHMRPGRVASSGAQDMLAFAVLDLGVVLTEIVRP